MIGAFTEDAIHPEAGRQAGPHLEIVVRKAAMHDIGPILELINGYAATGVMLPRTELEVSEDIRDFTVVLASGRLIACGALHFYTPSIAEIRSLAVAPDAKIHGMGRRLIESLVREATEYSLDAVFAFTYVADFFRKMGFEEVERGELPLKVWKDCVRCSKFQCCDEIAVLRILRPGYGRNYQNSRPYENSELVHLPVLGVPNGR